MIGLLSFVLAILASPFKSKVRLEAENAVLRHQLMVLRRGLHGRVRLTNHDRWFLIQLYPWFPSILQVLAIIQPETLVRWHRAGFRCYWRWKSRPWGEGDRRSTRSCAYCASVAPADVKKPAGRAAERASDRFRSRLTGGRIPLVKLTHKLDQLLEQRGRVILAIAHDDRRDHLRLVEVDETHVVAPEAPN